MCAFCCRGEEADVVAHEELTCSKSALLANEAPAQASEPGRRFEPMVEAAVPERFAFDEFEHEPETCRSLVPARAVEPGGPELLAVEEMLVDAQAALAPFCRRL